MKANEKTTAPRRGGRPSREQTAQLEDKILKVATSLFFADGYGATSIDAIAKRARISKRTFYHRYKDKSEIFKAVVQHVIERLRPPGTPQLFEGLNIEEILQRLARAILRATLSQEALALHRLIYAEGSRFPELAAIIGGQGARKEALDRLGALFQREAQAGHLKFDNVTFAAEQFMQMIVGVPQRRALGLGAAMSEKDLDAWARDTVRLFLKGVAVRN